MTVGGTTNAVATRSGVRPTAVTEQRDRGSRSRGRCGFVVFAALTALVSCVPLELDQPATTLSEPSDQLVEGRPTFESPCPADLAAARARLGDPLADSAEGSAPAFGALTFSALRRLEECAGTSLTAAGLQTLRTGRVAWGQGEAHSLEQDARLLHRMPWEAWQVLLAAGDGAAPLVVDEWAALEPVAPARRVDAAVLATTAAGSPARRKAWLEAIDQLSDADFDRLRAMSAVPVLMAYGPVELLADCLDLAASHAEAGIVALVALQQAGALKHCADVDRSTIRWFSDPELEADQLTARLRLLPEIRGTANALSAAMGVRDASGSRVVERLAAAYRRLGDDEATSWEQAVNVGLQYLSDPWPLAVAPTAFAASPGDAADGTRHLLEVLGLEGGASPSLGVGGVIQLLDAGRLGELDPNSPEGQLVTRLSLLEQVFHDHPVDDPESLLKAFGDWPEALTRGLIRLHDWGGRGASLRGLLDDEVALSGINELWLVPSTVSSPEEAGRLLNDIVDGRLKVYEDFEVGHAGEKRGKWVFLGEEALVRFFNEAVGLDTLRLLLGYIRAAAGPGEGPSSELRDEVARQLLVTLVLTIGGGALLKGTGTKVLTKVFKRVLDGSAKVLAGGGESRLAKAVLKWIAKLTRAVPKRVGQLLGAVGRRRPSTSRSYARVYETPLGRAVLDRGGVVLDLVRPAADLAQGRGEMALSRLVVKTPTMRSLVPGGIHRALNKSGKSPTLAYLTSFGLRAGGAGSEHLIAPLARRLPDAWLLRADAALLRWRADALAQQGATAANRSALVFLLASPHDLRLNDTVER